MRDQLFQTFSTWKELPWGGVVFQPVTGSSQQTQASSPSSVPKVGTRDGLGTQAGGELWGDYQ